MRKLVLCLAVLILTVGIAKAQDLTVVVTVIEKGVAVDYLILTVSNGIIRESGGDNVYGRIQGNILVTYLGEHPDHPDQPVSLGLFGDRWYIIRWDGTVIGMFEGSQIYKNAVSVGTLVFNILTLPSVGELGVYSVVASILPANSHDPNNALFVRLLALFLVLAIE